MVVVAAAVPGIAWVIAEASGSIATIMAPEAESAGEAGTGESAPEDADEDAAREPGAGDEDGARSPPADDRQRPDAEVPEDERISAPDMAQFAGADAELLRVLVDIEASERVMLAFQIEVVAIFEANGDVSDMLRAVSTAAGGAISDLGVLRDLLSEPVADEGTREVATTYVAHLDTWVDYLGALERDPQLLGGDLSRYTLPINVTGGRFARAVTARLEADVELDERIVDYANAVVERGFPPPEDAQA